MSQNRRPVRQGSSASNKRPASRPAATRPAPKAPRPRRQRRLPYDFKLLVVIGAVIILAALLAQMIWPDGFSITDEEDGTTQTSTVAEIHSSGPLRINELMSSNSSTAVDENGNSSDWIEIMNISNSDVNLAGYSLAKNEDSNSVFEFPNQVLAAGECVLVYADSTSAETAGEAYHAPFKLSSEGGTLMLFNSSGTCIDSVNFPALSTDTSYARQDETTWAVSTTPTPGLSNTEESYELLQQPRSDVGVEITEIVASNTQYAADENGEYQDYFEIHNTTDEAIDLSGWYVSDTVGKPTKWRLPDGFILEAGEYRIIYASGLDISDADYPHTSFSLSSEGEAVVLADDEGYVVDQVEYDLLDDDEAWLKASDGTWYSGTPSPNEANE